MAEKKSAPNVHLVRDKDQEAAQNSLWDNSFVCERRIGERVEGDVRQRTHFLFPLVKNEVLI